LFIKHAKHAQCAHDGDMCAKPRGLEFHHRARDQQTAPSARGRETTGTSAERMIVPDARSPEASWGTTPDGRRSIGAVKATSHSGTLPQ